jgi:hypothetical protein
MNDRKLECQAWVQREIDLAEAGRDELVADIERRKTALAENIKYPEPRHSEPETEAFLTDAAERAAVLKFVLDENRADRERRREASKTHYGDPEPRPASMTEYERSAAASQSWEQWVDARIGADSTSLAEAVGEYVTDALREQRKEIERAFNTKLAELKADLTTRVLGALETVVGIGAAASRERGERDVADLPPWPRRSEAKSVN